MNQSQYYMIQGSREIHHSPFYSAPSFFQFLEIWFEKSGSRNQVREIWFEESGLRKVVQQTRIFFLVREKWLTRKTGGFILQIHLFSGWRKMVLQTLIFFWFERSG